MNLTNNKELLTQAAWAIENLLTQLGAAPSEADLAFVQQLKDAAAQSQTLIFSRESTELPTSTRANVIAMIEGALPMLRKPTITPRGEGVDWMNLYWRLAQSLRYVDQQISLSDEVCAAYLRSSQGELVMVEPQLGIEFDGANNPPQPEPTQPPTGPVEPVAFVS